MTRDHVPDDLRRVVDAVRRAELPEGLFESVVAEVEATPQVRPLRFAWLPAASAVAAAAAVVAVVVFLGGRSGPVGQSPSPNGSAPFNALPVVGAIEGKIQVPDGAHPGRADPTSVWLGTQATGEVLRVDARSGDIVGTVQVNEPTTEPYDLWPVSDGASVWAAGRDDRALVRIDIGSLAVADRFPIDAVPYRIAPAGSVVWVTDFDDGRVLQVDAQSGNIISTTPLTDATGIAVTPDAVWVATYSGQLARIDPATGRATETFEIAGDATDVQVWDGQLWITGINGRRLERFDPGLGAVVAWTDAVWAVAFVDGKPWATVEGGLVLLDPASLAPTGVVPLPGAETDQLVATAGRLWAYGGMPGGTVLYEVRPNAP
jgi:hypothetical protein